MELKKMGTKILRTLKILFSRFLNEMRIKKYEKAFRLYSKLNIAIAIIPYIVVKVTLWSRYLYFFAKAAFCE